MKNFKSEAIAAVESGFAKNYILENTTAKPVPSRKYEVGEVVVNTDPKYKYRSDTRETFVTSLRWPYGGGYLLIDQKGNFHTTTNIEKVGEQRRPYGC